jgi:hypothetical protein
LLLREYTLRLIGTTALALDLSTQVHYLLLSTLSTFRGIAV